MDSGVKLNWQNNNFLAIMRIIKFEEIYNFFISRAEELAFRGESSLSCRQKLKEAYGNHYRRN